MLTESVWLSTGGLVVGPPMVWGITRWALPQEETRRPTRLLRAGRGLGLLASALVGLLSLFLLASLGARTGTALAPRLGPLSFLGVFMADLGDILNTLIVLLAALAGAGVLAGAAGRLGQFTAERLPAAVNRVLDPLLAAAAGAVIAVCIGLALRWTYQLTDLRQTVYGPAALGALLGLALAIRASRNSTLPVGLVVYYITRTIFNTLRSIEPLVMAIVFVVWVGIGPFAGVLALALHTVVALAKLYSEQVESILPGPLEAITATGATRMQTVIYAVAPQIVPPYISFTMYRWDINVRMSTIIGFVGGGGIGLLLQQNINLLLYRAASAQMLAIAIVVASMDYLSSRLREHVI
ncbi:MAG: ABC transporter permease subunit [Chloroflexi bacterium]|nr:ABC transporter permease subunit [Chloroflexota bacterium]